MRIDQRPDLRPDLSRILPRPALRARGLPFSEVASPPGDGNASGYLVDLEPRRRPEPGEIGFDLRQAQAAAERVSRAIGRRALRPGLFALDPGRVQRLLS